VASALPGAAIVVTRQSTFHHQVNNQQQIGIVPLKKFENFMPPTAAISTNSTSAICMCDSAWV
jgi:hypothetical protein